MKFFINLFFLLLSSVLFAQKITVVSQTTSEPVSGVAVYNQNKSISTISDLDGVVVLDHFSESDKITFKHISYHVITLNKTEVPAILKLVPYAQDLEEVVISASKFEQNKKEVPQKVISIKSEDIAFQNPQTSADLLQNSGQVFVQKSQLGGGSPMMPCLGRELISPFAVSIFTASLTEVRLISYWLQMSASEGRWLPLGYFPCRISLPNR